MGKVSDWIKEKDLWSRVIQLAAFSVSCYLTMGMFAALVDGAVKIWIFRSFGFIYETSKLSVLQRSFTIQEYRRTTRVFAVLLMAVSVAGAVLSAVKDTMAAEAEYVAGLSSSKAKLDDLLAQRADWQAKLNGLSPEYKTSSIAYGQEIQRLQEEIDLTRSRSDVSSVAISKKSGVFEEASRVVFQGRVPANLIRLLFFVAFIVLNELVLYFETFFVSRSQKGGKFSTFEDNEIETLVKEKFSELRQKASAGESEDLF